MDYDIESENGSFGEFDLFQTIDVLSLNATKLIKNIMIIDI